MGSGTFGDMKNDDVSEGSRELVDLSAEAEGRDRISPCFCSKKLVCKICMNVLLVRLIKSIALIQVEDPT